MGMENNPEGLGMVCMTLDYRLAAIRDAIVEHWGELGLEACEVDDTLVVRVRNNAEGGQEGKKA